MHLVGGADGNLVWLSIESLLNEFPDDEARKQVEGRLDDKRIWYYHLTRIQGCLARHFPNLPSSLRVVRHALEEIDGPQLSDLAESYETHSSLREEILRASAAAPEDVRKAVAVTVQDRAFDFKTVELLTPCVLAEESDQVRTTALTARARASAGVGNLEREMSNTLIEELHSLGTYCRSRHRTALAVLIEMGRTEEAIKALSDQGGSRLNNLLSDFWRQDVAALTIICDSWHEVSQKSSAAGLESELPFLSLIQGGYGAILEQNTLACEMFDEHLRATSEKSNSVEYLTEYARRFPKSNFLKERLLSVFGPKVGHFSIPTGSERIAAGLIVDNFEFDEELQSRLHELVLSDAGEVPEARAGVVAILALGWPSSKFAGRLRKCSKKERESWSKRDQLLAATALGDWAEAESAAISMLQESPGNWGFRVDDNDALRRWSREESTMSTLARWSMVEKGTLSVTGLSLIGSQRAIRVLSLNELIARFNEEMGQCLGAPTDGLDAVSGKVRSWADQALAISHESMGIRIGK